MKKYVIFIFIVIELSSFAQKSPNQNINLSVGLGQTPGYYNFDSYGLAYSIGYERQILKKIISKALTPSDYLILVLKTNSLCTKAPSTIGE